jgi:hypothetical protein
MASKMNSFQKISMTSTIAVLAMVGLGQAPALADNLVTNGSFEDSVLNNGSWGIYDQISGWKATTGGKIEIQKNAAGAAYNGSSLMELDSDHFSSNKYDINAPVIGLFQDIATKVGQQYSLSFAYSARPGVVGAGQNSFSVLFGDQFKESLDAGKGAGQTNWNIFKTTLTASSALTRLQFNYDGIRDSVGAYIDDVKLEAIPVAQAVPEPTTLLGLVGVGLVARKLKRSARTA